MQYMLLIYDDESVFKTMPEAEVGKLMADYREFTQGIVKSGHFRAGDQLAPTASATTVRQRAGKIGNTDGPFAETKEQLGGYYLVECKDLDEALSIAARIPSVRIGGSIEVRPVVTMKKQ
jgi:hypothetical protein